MRKFYQKQLQAIRQSGVVLNVKLNSSTDDLREELWSLQCGYCPVPNTGGKLLGEYWACCGID